MSATSQRLPELPGKPQQRKLNSSRDDPFFCKVVQKYRSHVFAQRIRLREIFQDFDPLRCGLMTESRFGRCIATSMAKGAVLPLNVEEVEVLIKYFGSPNTGKVRWREFVDTIDTVFEANADDPLVKSSAPYQRPLSPESEEWLDEVILRLKSYVKHHGYDVKSWFTDFDKYNNGYVTYNQFRRGIPQNLLSQEEEELLVAQYGEPLTGTVNYFKLNTTVNRKKPKAATTDQRLVAKAKQEDGYEEHIPLGTEEILHTVFTANVKPDCRTVEDKIKKIVFKDRIRLMEFFRDYDRHNSGIVSENHFLAGLRLCPVVLDATETSCLTDAYKSSTGFGVKYREFCTSIDSVFTINHLESNPLQEVKQPSRDWLVQTSNELPKEEEIQCSRILAKLKEIFKQRRILVVPFFKDFDRVLFFNGSVYVWETWAE